MHRAYQRVCHVSCSSLRKPPHWWSTSTNKRNNSTALFTSAAATATLFGAGSGALCYAQQKSNQHEKQKDKEKLEHKLSSKTRGLLECNLMDRLAAKPYLRAPPFVTNYEGAADINDDEEAVTRRPRGIPKTLRILVIDLPEFQNYLDEDCITDIKKVYPEGMAPPKWMKKQQQIPKHDRKSQPHQDSDSHTLEIAQKALVHSLTRCGGGGRNGRKKGGGTELLQASIANLNPRRMKRQLALVRKRTRPSSTSSSTEALAPPDKGVTSRGASRKDADYVYAEEIVTGEEDDTNLTYRRQKQREEEEEELEREMDAPWNQYAWREELKLRMNGDVQFDAPMERGSHLSYLFFGRAYRKTTKTPKRSWWRSVFFVFGKEPLDVDGDDGRRGKKIGRPTNPASNKPHAVIANGEAMHRVPGALRELLRCCKEAHVPLFVVNDPRVWGSNSHQDLPSATVALRNQVKSTLIAQALQLQYGTLFQRGRSVGKWEAQVKHGLQAKKQHAEQVLKEAAAAAQGGWNGGKRSSASGRRLSGDKRDKEAGAEDDWSEWDVQRLEKELIKHKLIEKVPVGQKSKDGGTTKEWKYRCTPEFRQICQVCRGEVEKRDEVDAKTMEENASATSSTEKEEEDEEDSHPYADVDPL